MPFVLAAAGVLIALLLVFGSGCSRNGKPAAPPPGSDNSQTPEPTTRTAKATGKEIRSMSREEMAQKLKRLEKASTPKPKMGAMCYDIAAPPQRAEYVCPDCGEKTLYTDEVAFFLGWELESCRRDFDKANWAGNLQMKLDESSFCQHCRPEAKVHQLALIITYSDGTTHTTAPVQEEDLRILRNFLEGQVMYETFNGGTWPLKEKLPRLRELLGMNAKPIDPKTLEKIP